MFPSTVDASMVWSSAYFIGTPTTPIILSDVSNLTSSDWCVVGFRAAISARGGYPDHKLGIPKRLRVNDHSSGLGAVDEYFSAARLNSKAKTANPAILALGTNYRRTLWWRADSTIWCCDYIVADPGPSHSNYKTWKKIPRDSA